METHRLWKLQRSWALEKKRYAKQITIKHRFLQTAFFTNGFNDPETRFVVFQKMPWLAIAAAPILLEARGCSWRIHPVRLLGRSWVGRVSGILGMSKEASCKKHRNTGFSGFFWVRVRVEYNLRNSITITWDDASIKPPIAKTFRHEAPIISLWGSGSGATTSTTDFQMFGTLSNHLQNPKFALGSLTSVKSNLRRRTVVTDDPPKKPTKLVDASRKPKTKHFRLVVSPGGFFGISESTIPLATTDTTHKKHRHTSPSPSSPFPGKCLASPKSGRLCLLCTATAWCSVKDHSGEKRTPSTSSR